MTQSADNADHGRPNRAAMVVGLALIAVAAVILWDAVRISGIVSYARVGPATFAYVVGGFMAVLGAITAIAGYLGRAPQWEVPQFSPVAWIAGGMILQIILLRPAGFSIATGVLFAMTACGFGRRPLWLGIVIGIPIAFVIWIIFARFLMLSLPAGPLERLIP